MQKMEDNWKRNEEMEMKKKLCLCRCRRLRKTPLTQLWQNLPTRFLKLSDMVLNTLGHKVGSMVLGITIDKGTVRSHEVEEDGVIDKVVFSRVDFGGF